MPGVKATLAISENPLAAFRGGPTILLRVDQGVAGDRNQMLQKLRRRSDAARDCAVLIRHLSPPDSGDEVMDVALVGPETYALRKLADEVVARLHKHKDFVAASCERLTAPHLDYDVDRERVALLGVTVGQVTEVLQAYSSGIEVGQLRLLEREVPVKVELALYRLRSPDDFAAAKLRGANGQFVSLNDIAKVTNSLAPLRIDRFNFQPMVRLYVSPASGVSPAAAWRACQAVAAEVRTQSGLGEAYRLQWLSTQPEPGK